MIPIHEKQQELLDSKPTLHTEFGVTQLTGLVRNRLGDALALGDVPTRELGLSGDAKREAETARRERAISHLQDAQFYLILLQNGITAMFAEAAKPA